MRGVLKLEIALDHFLNILANQQFVQILQIWKALKEENSLDQLIGVFHFIDGFFVFFRRELGDTPVFVHSRMQEVLVNGRQLVGEDLVQMLDDFFVAFHNRIPCVAKALTHKDSRFNGNKKSRM